MVASGAVADGAGNDGALTRIETRLERIEAVLGRLENITGQVPGLLAMAGDVLDEAARRDGRMDERGTAIRDLVERATRPETLRALSALLDLLEQAPGLLGMVGDVVDEASGQVAAAGVDLHEATENGMALMRGVVQLLSYPETAELIESGILSRGALRGVNRVAASIAAADAEPIKPIGPLGAALSLGNRDLQYALGFALNVGRALGHSLERSESPTHRITADNE